MTVRARLENCNCVTRNKVGVTVVVSCHRASSIGLGVITARARPRSLPVLSAEMGRGVGPTLPCSAVVVGVRVRAMVQPRAHRTRKRLAMLQVWEIGFPCEAVGSGQILLLGFKKKEDRVLWCSPPGLLVVPRLIPALARPWVTWAAGIARVPGGVPGG